MAEPRRAPAAAPLRKAPWRDYSGAVSPMKAMVFIALFLPGAVNGWWYATDQLGADPTNAFIHAMGLWMMRFLVLGLAVTPLRHALRWPRLLLVRRMIGVAAFAYGAVHITAYAGDQMFKLLHVAAEIVLRFYLTIGFIALMILAALTATSTDAMQRRFGARRWQRLQRLVYPAAVLGLVHYFQQAKSDVWEPTIVAGIVLWLLAWRVVAWRWGQRRADAFTTLAGLSIAAAALTGLGEAIYFNLKLGADPLLVLMANLTLDTGLRPAPVVLAFGLAATFAAPVAAWLEGARRRQRTAPAPAQ